MAQSATVRLACVNCDRADCDGITWKQLNKLKSQGWEGICEVQSYEQSIVTYDDPDDAPPDFDVMFWYTHTGTCPECAKEEE